MEYLCPLCNGLKEVVKYCSKCGSLMKDDGRVQDYYDDYSPYLSYVLTDVLDGEPSGICQHIFTCTVCGKQDHNNINKIVI